MIPNYQQAMLPVLEALADGQRKDRKALTAAVSAKFTLTDSERAAMLPSGKGTVVLSRTGWAISYLRNAGLIFSYKRGAYEITDRGRAVLAKRPPELSNDDLEEFEEFRQFMRRSRGTDEAEPATVEVDLARKTTPKRPGTPIDVSSTPDEDLEIAYRRLRGTVEAELLDTVRGTSPAFFEQIVVDLLVHMGYGGTRVEAARAIGKSGDGGIDGVIDQDRLGLDSVYIQAKRWESTVGRPELQKFAGALQGQRASKGVFITTSTFSRDAVDYASRINARIVLIDGDRLASLMFEHDVGVGAKQTYVVKALDGDYFDAGT